MRFVRSHLVAHGLISGVQITSRVDKDGYVVVRKRDGKLVAMKVPGWLVGLVGWVPVRYVPQVCGDDGKTEVWVVVCCAARPEGFFVEKSSRRIVS